jgi:hypothetical protein
MEVQQQEVLGLDQAAYIREFFSFVSWSIGLVSKSEEGLLM